MENQRKPKVLWICGILATAIYYFAPLTINSLHQRPAGRSATSPIPLASTPASPPSTIPNSAAATPATVSPAPALPTSGLMGKWQGTTLLQNRGGCNLKLELRANPDPPAPFSGYSILACSPSAVFTPRNPKAQSLQQLFKNFGPSSAVLSGSAENGSILFHVDKTIGDTCPPTTFTVTPFGTNQLAAEWKDPCGGGDMILTKTR